MADAEVRPWTREDLDRLPDDGNRYEVLDGELFVTPFPDPFHQLLATTLMVSLHTYCETHGLGMVFHQGAVVWADNALLPDVVVFPGVPEELRADDWSLLQRPRLVVEVESDYTRRRDRGLKRAAYIDELAISTYWIVDPEAHVVSVVAPQTPDVSRSVHDVLEWTPDPNIPPFTTAVSALFRLES